MKDNDITGLFCDLEISHACQVTCDPLKGGTRIVMMEAEVVLSLFSWTHWKVGFCFPFEKPLYPSALQDFWEVT